MCFIVAYTDLESVVLKNIACQDHCKAFISHPFLVFELPTVFMLCKSTVSACRQIFHVIWVPILSQSAGSLYTISANQASVHQNAWANGLSRTGHTMKLVICLRTFFLSSFCFPAFSETVPLPHLSFVHHRPWAHFFLSFPLHQSSDSVLFSLCSPPLL